MSTAIRQHLSARVLDARRRDPDAGADAPEPGDRGFVLLEEIVSITLLMIVMAALATFFITVTQSTTYERGRQTAVQIANTEMDAVNAVSAGDLYLGRTQQAVSAQFSSAPPTVAAALQTTQQAYDTNTPVSTLTLPMSSTTVANNITYTVSDYLGNCWIPTVTAVGTACTNTAAAMAAGIAYVRAVVSVTWPGNHCPQVNGSGLCTYVTSSLISAAGDPTFNLCTLGAACGPAPPQLVNPGPQFSVVNTAASLQLALTPYTGVAPITWSATGLPSWLTLNTSTGLITGTAPAAPAAAVTVVVTATDAFARTAQTMFTWTVVNPPTITGLTNPYTATAGLAITSQTLPYTCPTSSCTYTLAGAPSGIGLATSSTGTGAATQTVTNTSGNLYLVGTVASSAAASTTAYPTDVTNQRASNYWRLDETSGTTGVDSIGGNNLVEQAGVTHGAAGGIATNSDGASTFDGASDGSAATTTAITAPTTFSESIWFRTTTTAGGKLLGFGNAATGLSSTYDRQIYMDNAGHLDFGVYNGTTNVVATSNTYNDGKWHQAVGTLSPTGGMVFYVDGVNVGSNAAVTTPQYNVGYWRLGGDNLAGWSPQPTSYYFAGTLDDASIYPSALTAAQVQQQYTDSQGTAYTVTATPKDVITGTVGTVNQAAWTVLPPVPPTITGLTNPFVTAAGATITGQPLPYTCATSSCTYTLAGAPTGIGLSTSPTAAGPFATALTVTGSTSGTLYLRGTVDPAAATSAAYANDVASQGATNYWHLGETSGTTGVDSIGSMPLTESAGVGHGAPGAIFTAPGTASTFDGSSLGTARTQVLIAAPSTFSESIWFKTTTTLGGQLIGFGDSRTDARSGAHDRQLYMDTSGHVIFGVSPSAGLTSVVVSTSAYNDGAWHQAVATMKSGPGGGQSLYIDGKSVGTPQPITTTTPYSGYWRLGGDDLSAWPAGPASNFTGTLDEASIYPIALTPAQILQQYTDAVAASYTVTVTPVDNVTGVVGTTTNAAWTVDPVPTLTGMVTPFTTTAGATIATQPLPYTCPSTSCTESLAGAPAGIGLDAADTGSPQSSLSTTTATSGNVYLRGTVGSAAGTSNAYATDIQTPALGATNYWRLGEASGTTGTNLISGGSNLTYGTGVGHGALGAIFTSPDTASTFSGAADGSGTASSQTSVAAPAQLSESIWFKTTTTVGGWLIGMTNVTTGSGNYDRVLYMDNSGHVVSMLYNGTFQRTISPGTYNDGSWHQAVVTISPTLGVSLYVDGSLVSANANYTSSAFSAYWRIGGGGRLVADLPNISSNYFQGSLDEPAVFSTVLGAADVSKQYLDAQRVAYSLTGTPTDATTSVSGPVDAATWAVKPAPVVSGLLTPFSTTVGATITPQPLSYSCPAGICTFTLTGAPAGIGLSTTATGSAQPSVAVNVTTGSLYLVGTVGAAVTSGSYTLSVTPQDTASQVNGAATTASWTVISAPTVSGLTTPFATTVGATIATQTLQYSCPTGSCTFTATGLPANVGISTTSTGGALGTTATVTSSTSGVLYLRGTVAASVVPGTYNVVVTPTDTLSGANGTASSATWTVYGAPTVNGLVTPFTTTAGAVLVGQALPYTCPTSSCTYTVAGAPAGVGLDTDNVGPVSNPLTVTGSASGTIYLRGTVSASATPSSTAYTADVRSQGASNYWRLDETSGTTGADSIGTSPLTEQAGVGHGVGGGIASNSDTASTFDGSSVDGSASTTTAVTGPQTFSESVWFRTTTTRGGWIMGFANTTTGISNLYDRIIYMDNAGYLDFGTCGVGCNGSPTVVTSARPYNDGQWHQAVGTLSSAGLSFYIDGSLIGTNTAVTTAYGYGANPAYTGYWRLGGNNLGGWPGNITSQYFAGTLDDASVYPTALTAAQVQQQYSDSGRVPYSVTVTPADTASGIQGAANQAAWTVDSPPVVTGLTTPFVTSAGATVVNQTLPYSCPTNSCTVALTGAPAGIGISTASTGTVSTTATVTATTGGVLYLRGTVSSSASGTYTVAVTPTDTASSVSGTPAQVTWTVYTAPTTAGLPSGFGLTVGEVVPNVAVTYTCPTASCTLALNAAAPAGLVLSTGTGGGSATSVSVNATSGTVYVSGTIASSATLGPYTVSVIPTDNVSGAVGVATTGTGTIYAAPTVTGQTTPLKTSVGATIANDSLNYTCPSGSCTFTVANAPSGIGLYAGTTTTPPTTAVTSLAVTATSGTIYLRGTILASTPLGNSTVTVTPTATDPASGINTNGPVSSAAWTLVAAMSVGSPGTISKAAGTSISQPITYVCPQGSCTITLNGYPTGVGMSTVQNTSAAANSTTTVTVTGSGTAYAQGKTPTGSGAVGTYSVSATIADAVSSTVTGTSGTWTITATAVLGVSGLTNPFTTTAGAVLTSQPLPYTCPSGSCTLTLAGAPAGVGLAATTNGTTSTSLAVTATSGTVYLRGTVSSVTPTSLTYPADVRTQGATDYWRLGETVSGTGADSIGTLPLTELAGVQPVASGAIAGSVDGAATFDGSSADGSASTTTSIVAAAGTSYSESVWFKTTTTSGGKLLGFETTVTGTSGSSDRQLYLDNAGHVDFGRKDYNVSGGAQLSVASPATYNDGQWHEAVGTVAAGGAGTSLYVDGVKVASNTAANNPVQQNSGYWRLGGGNLSGWPNQPTSNYFAGTLDEAAIYQGVALSAGQVATQYADASAASYAVTVTPTSGSTSGTANSAAWTVYPQPTVTGLATPFVTALGSVIANHSLTYTCPTANCTYTLAGTPGGVGLSTDTTGTTSSSVTVGATTGTIYLRGTVSSAASAGSYPVTVTPTDVPSGVVAAPLSSMWNVQATPSTSAYANDVNGPASNYWRLGEATGPLGLDSAGLLPLTEQAGVGHGATGAILTNPTNNASTFDGSSTDGSATTIAPFYAAPTTNLSLSIWFRTTTTSGGKLIGFENTQTGLGTSADRQIYMDNAGHLTYSVNSTYPAGVNALTTSGTYNDGQWHEAVATLSGSGMALYVDGQLVQSNPAVTGGAVYYQGFWRLGGGAVLNGNPGTLSSTYFAGTLDEAAVYPSALTLAQVQQQYLDSGRTP